MARPRKNVHPSKSRRESPTGGGKRVVLYARVSTQEQEKEGFSIPAQMKLLHAYADAQGMTIAAEHVDVETARKTGRTEFEAMLRYIRKHPSAGTILVEKTDRLYRNIKDWVTLDDAGVEIHLVKEGVDAAVRVAVLRDSSFVMHKIADCRRILCAAPAYLQRHGVPSLPDDLFRHNCLLLRFPGSQQFTWTLQGPDGPVKLAVAGRLDADDGDVLTGWALAGEGIVMKPAFEIAEELRSGALVPLLEDFPPEPATLAVLYPSRQLLPAKVRAFVDFTVPRLRTAIEQKPA